MSSPRIAIIIYSMFGHIAKSKFFFLPPSFLFFKKKIADRGFFGSIVAEGVKSGIIARGGNAEILQLVLSVHFDAGFGYIDPPSKFGA